MGRPRKAEGDRYVTPITNFRIPLPTKAKVRKLATERGETDTAFVLRAIEREIRRCERHAPKESPPTPPDTPTQE